MVDRDFVICPSCGERNIRGEDLCWNCMMGLADIDVPETAQPVSESAFTRPLSNLRLRQPVIVAPSDPVRRVIEVMRQDPAGAAVIVSDGKAAGIFTERDVLMRIAGHPERLDEPVAHYMTPDPEVVDDADMMAVVLNRMGDGGFRHLPVTVNGEIGGMVTANDVARWVLLNYFDED